MSSTLKKIAYVFLWSVLLASIWLLCENCYFNITIILGYLGLIYFSIKSIIVFVKTIIKETSGHEDYIIPILGLCYAGFSFYFISYFFSHSNEISDWIINSFKPTIDYEYARRLIRFATYCVVIAFTWNFSKAFYTLNSIEFGELNSEKVTLQTANNGGSVVPKVIPEIILRIIVAVLFIYIEKQLKEIKSLDEIISLSFYLTILYVAMIAWVLWFSKIFDKPSGGVRKNMIIQFIMGLIIGFFIACARIAPNDSFPTYSVMWNAVLGSICFIIPSFILSYSIVRVEIVTFSAFWDSLSVGHQTNDNTNGNT